MRYFENWPNFLDLCYLEYPPAQSPAIASSRASSTTMERSPIALRPSIALPFGLHGSLQMLGTLASSEEFNSPKNVIADDQHRAQSSIQSSVQSSAQSSARSSYPIQLSNPAIQPSCSPSVQSNVSTLPIMPFKVAIADD